MPGSLARHRYLPPSMPALSKLGLMGVKAILGSVSVEPVSILDGTGAGQAEAEPKLRDARGA